MKIAIQGYRGSFHHQTALNLFPNEEVELEECATFREVASLTANSLVDFGIMAIENSIAGSLLPNYSLIASFQLHIYAEHYLHIEHCLMGKEGETLSSLTEVRSHPMALLQCELFFEPHKHIRLVEMADTALAAKEVSLLKHKGVGAIAPAKAAQLYNLSIISKGIQTIKNNHTRFFLLGKKPFLTEHANKASVLFKLAHEKGSLAEILQIIAENGLNLTHIQSLPSLDSPWEYAFHVDMLYPSLAIFENTITSLKQKTKDFRVLGHYVSAWNPD